MSRLFRLGIVFGALLVPLVSRAACPGVSYTLLPDLLYNNPAVINPVNAYEGLSFTRPFWGVVAAQTWGAIGSSDYDVAVYSGASGGAEPVCLSGLLAGSARTASSTDFVIGDFNHNPYGTYYTRVNCYSGDCTGMNLQMRDGGFVLSVNGSALTVSSVPGVSTTNKQLINVYDVYLNTGTHYYFNFQATGTLSQRMLLFRNPTNGVYWAGRNDAVFETAGCTTYDAPSSGYYGLVVVKDGQPSYDAGTYSISVTTQPVCSCPGVLANDVPVTTAPGPAIDYRLATQPYRYWSAVGLRSASDWDMQAATLARDHPNVNCAGVLLGGSYQAGDPVEVVVSDGNGIVLPDTLEITSATFVGNQPATVQMDGGPDYAPSRGWKFGGSLAPGDVVRAWDVSMQTGDLYGVKLQSFGTSARAMLFRNPGGGRYVAGRTDAVFSTADTATYVAPATDVYGLVLLHEDAVAGGVLLEGGSCVIAPALVEGPPPSLFQNLFTSITPTAASWGVASVLGNGSDYDVQLYGGQSGPGYPDCFSDPSASSAGAGSNADFLVGDFRSAPLVTTYVRFYDFAMNPTDAARAEWSQAHVPVIVNGAIVADDMGYHVAVVHEVHLIAGAPCQIQFVPGPSESQKVLLFGNSGSGAYWAPRSAALAQTNSAVSFTPPYTGAYALVVVDDDLNDSGTTHLSVTDGVTAAPVPSGPRVTRLAGAGSNPSRGTLELSYELAEPAELTFDLIDVTGRVVSHLGLGCREAGAGQARWTPTEGGGASAAPGVYFVRMTAGVRTIGTRRVALVR
jgi:hypothetical protein